MKIFDIILYIWGGLCFLYMLRMYIRSVIFIRRLEHEDVRITLKLYDGTIVSFNPNSDKVEDIREMIQALEKLRPR